MKRTILAATLVAASTLGLTGCSTLNNMDHQTMAVIGGAALGGALGAAVFSSEAAGALVGAGAGGWAGYELGQPKRP